MSVHHYLMLLGYVQKGVQIGRKTSLSVAKATKALWVYAFIWRIDPCLGCQTREMLSLINVSAQQSYPAEGCQPGVRVGMHGS